MLVLPDNGAPRGRRGRDVLVTTDNNIRHQHNLRDRQIGRTSAFTMADGKARYWKHRCSREFGAAGQLPGSRSAVQRRLSCANMIHETTRALAACSRSLR